MVTDPISCIKEPTLYKAHATIYVLDGITASGVPVRQGICASGNPEWFGKRLALYQRNGDEVLKFLGIFDCLDRGCAPTTIDVWFEDVDAEITRDFINLTWEDGCNGRVWVCVVGDVDGYDKELQRAQ